MELRKWNPPRQSDARTQLRYVEEYVAEAHEWAKDWKVREMQRRAEARRARIEERGLADRFRPQKETSCTETS